MDTLKTVDLRKSEYYFNRHLSLMQFNLRVLEQALNEQHPLLERLQFLLIFSSNLDEFFEVRVAELKRQISFAREVVTDDGLRAQDVLHQLSDICQKAIEKQYRILNETLLPALKNENIHFLSRQEWTPDIEIWASDYLRTQTLPVISPIGLDPAHPFPRLVNKSLNFIVSLEGRDAFGRESGLAIVPAPRSLPRIIRVPDQLCGGGDNFVFLSSLIHAHVDDLFPGMRATGCYQFRLTRDADLNLNAAEVEDIARALRGELHSRRFGSAVRLEVTAECPDVLINFLLEEFNLSERDLFRVSGPVNLGRMMQLRSMINRPDLVFPPFTPSLPEPLRDDPNLFQRISNEDILLHQPYQSFTPVIDLLRQAGRDPHVLAIKMTLYRTGSRSEVVDALSEAARAGKEVTVVIELRARFDEEENLQLAAHLQEAGAVVTYGVVGYKTHAKALLVVRRENNALRRYVHLGTGNYHAGNARLYTDYSLLTADEDLCSDVHKIFQQLTGMGRAERIKKLASAPFTLRKNLVRLIEGEAIAARAGKPAHIILKANSLTDAEVIRCLYAANCAGVQVDLIIRGMCCLRPGLAGVSENIRVRSVIGRFLEHSRVYYFSNAEPGLYCSSADLMERNLQYRVEIAFPISNHRLSNRVLGELKCYLDDNCQSWVLQPDGEYVLNQPASGETPKSAQSQLLAKLAE
ncbi:MAG: polyphosphate kinase 1 [Porticoccaceae bacterium]